MLSVKSLCKCATRREVSVCCSQRYIAVYDVVKKGTSVTYCTRCVHVAEEDKARVGLTGLSRGVLSRVAGRLSLTSSDTKQHSDSSLADQWLDFLVQQAEAADAAEIAANASASSQVPAESPSAISKPVLAVQHNWNSMQSPFTTDT